MVDAVRAARALPEAAAGPQFALWGHSQGGHAALFAGQLAAVYAPELELVGVAVAAPATDPAATLKVDIGSGTGRIITSYALWSWSRVYGVSLDGVVGARAMPVMERIAADCAESLGEMLRVSFDATALKEDFLVGDPATAEPWRDLLLINTPGREPIHAPLFIAQGDVDHIVPPAVTTAFADAMRRRGQSVSMVILPATGHLIAGRDAAHRAVAWMQKRFASGSDYQTTY
jgi:acetyl esterase/lipase